MINFKFKNTYFFWVSILVFTLISCKDKSTSENATNNPQISQNTVHDSLSLSDVSSDIKISTPANYLTLIKQKRTGIVGNHTSVVKNKKNGFTHLVDTLISLNIDIKKVFAPEHGFRGKADAGEKIADGKDPITGLPTISLYGKNKKPSSEQLKDLDIIIFDIQDVGTRFYTYISTLHYVMEACAEANIPLIVIDRPNPNGHYIDGPMREEKYKSFVGMHPVPIVYGMTIGEYAQMINGEKWLENNVKCDLTVMPLKNYTHQTPYSLPIKPSPNLPNDISINLYPSLCFFEGTEISAGRGTEMQFQIFGAPFLPKGNFTFKPQSNEGAKNPKFKDELCYGKDLRTVKKLNSINLEWLIETYNESKDKENFFNSFMPKLAGTKKMQQQIEQGLSSDEIKKTWQADIANFKKIRLKYLMYN
ncbi:DUF1343 domain-containing protein [Aureibaculum sp. A20]|uniref:DUF1343 domain-containing protein n=1 Tax=Aureibaculum flavum TaxID=2795986 RepID=A0ABS0WX19_9FLAO|nr:DUF1343 domain-containing protein [Aureibaculum flavum]MBJ2176532.1 DUF1343 domain-containing protein [Aureibaculum flavum]